LTDELAWLMPTGHAGDSTRVTTQEATRRKTDQEKRKPTPSQERGREDVLPGWRVRDTAAWEQRRTWWRRGQGQPAMRFQQEAARQHIRAAVLDSAARQSPVLQDGLARLDKS